MIKYYWYVRVLAKKKLGLYKHEFLCCNFFSCEFYALTRDVQLSKNESLTSC